MTPLEIAGRGMVSSAGVGLGAFARALDAGRDCGPRMPIDDALEAAWLAACEALDEAGIDPRRQRVGLALGTALGGLVRGDEYRPPSALTEALAARLDLRGPTSTWSVTCASGLYALEQAALDLAHGRADAMLVGGTDMLAGLMQSGFAALQAQIALGEAACFVVLAPGGRHGQVLGRGLSADGSHLTAPDDSGAGMLRAIEQAAPELDRVAAISVTATAAPAYHQLYRNVLARTAPRPVLGWEYVTGHVLAASGVVGLVHATLRLPALDGDLLALTVGFGGQNGATRIGRC